MKEILAGVERFQENVFPGYKDHFKKLADRQEPRALFITCADSRVLPNLITQTEPGDLFICRDVGNIVPPYGAVYGGVSATIEYSVVVLKVPHVIVCGHSDCGAMRALLNPDRLRGLPGVIDWLRHAEAPHHAVTRDFEHVEPEEKLAMLVEENVVTQLEHLRTYPSVMEGLADKSLRVHGWVYEIETGSVRIYDDVAGLFKPVSGSSAI